MLVLRRKVGETVQIGDDIEVTVLAVEGDRIKLGLQAPLDVEIVRKELLDEVTAENKRASVIQPSLEVLKQLQKLSKENKRDM